MYSDRYQRNQIPPSKLYLSYNPLFFKLFFLIFFFNRKVVLISKWGQGVIVGRHSPILMVPLYVSARALTLLR